MLTSAKDLIFTTREDCFDKHQDFSNSSNQIDRDLFNRELISKTESITEQQLLSEPNATRSVLADSISNAKNTMNIKKSKIFDLKGLPKITVYPTLPDSYYIDLQEFEGVVVSIAKDNKTFKAKLVNKSTKDEFLGTFEVDEIPSDDKELFRSGAIFIWKLGKEQNNGTQQNISQINFRRLPSFKKSSLKKIQQTARERADAFRKLTTGTSSSK